MPVGEWRKTIHGGRGPCISEQARAGFMVAVGAAFAAVTPALEVVVDLVDTGAYPTIKAYVSVPSDDGEPVCRIEDNGFRLSEWHQARDLQVSTGTSTAVSIGILLEDGAAMDRVLDRVRTASRHFVELLGGNDRAAIYSFADSARPLHSMLDVAVGRNRQTLIESLDRYQSRDGGSQLYAAIGELIHRDLGTRKEMSRRKVMVAVVGGRSAGRLEAAIHAAGRDRVAVYAIGMGTVDATAMDTLARETGGRFYRLSAEPTAEELTAAYRDVRRRLDCQYTLLYETADVCPDGATVPLRVEVPSLGIEGHAEVRRPLDYARIDLNLRLAGDAPPAVREAVECDDVEIAAQVSATSCSDQLVLPEVVVRAFAVDGGEPVEVATSERLRVHSNGPPVATVVKWDTRGIRGDRLLELTIDPGDDVVETHLADNVREARIVLRPLQHDLYVKSIEIAPQPAAPCDLVELAVTVGDRSWCPGLVLHHVEVEARDGDHVLGRAVTALELGAPEPVFFEWEPAGFVGQRQLTFVVDPDGRLRAEKTRRNNVEHALVTVRPGTCAPR